MNTLKAQWLLHATSGWKIKRYYILSTKCISVIFLNLRTAIISFYSIGSLIFIIKTQCLLRGTICIYRVSQEEWTKLRESVPYVKLYRYNPKHLYPKLNGYGDNGQRSLKFWQLLLTYWLTNTYWNWQEYVVSVMLISVLNIKVTCEWHKGIKLNYKNTRTHGTVVLRVTKHCTYRQ